MPFSRDELSVLFLLATGKTPAEIATQLNLPEKTVVSTRKSINRKLKVKGVNINDMKKLSPEILEKYLNHKW